MIWIAFGVGLCVGTFAGIFTIGLCQMAAKSERFNRLRLGDYCRYDGMAPPNLVDSHE